MEIVGRVKYLEIDALFLSFLCFRFCDNFCWEERRGNRIDVFGEGVLVIGESRRLLKSVMRYRL